MSDFYLLHLFTLHPKLKKPNETIYSRVKFFKCILPHASNALLPPIPFASSHTQNCRFISKNVLPSIAMSSHICCPAAHL